MNTGAVRTALDGVYRAEARRVRATLIRLLGGFDAAEEAMHEAFLAAAAQWPRDGTPANPAGWLVSVARFKAIDRRRRETKLTDALPEIASLLEPVPEPTMPDAISDDELRLIFTCCHPALPPDARIALALREICGLTTEEIARAFLTRTPTIAQRIVRAKAKIRDDAIPYEVPAPADFGARIESVLLVIYLIFNEGYAATGGPELIRTDLCAEAIRLGRLAVDLLDEPEAKGLLALMLLHESRRTARVDARGELVLLEDQDRSLWNRPAISEAEALIDRALATRRAGPYLLQAAIAAVHAQAPDTVHTDWTQIAGLYDVLWRIDPSPVIALNRAVAVAMRDGPEAGLAAVDSAMAGGTLDRYHLAHAARADMLRRLDRTDEARAAYERALDLALQPAERRFLQRRLDELAGR